MPSAACQCAIQASSAGNGSGSPVRLILRSSFSVIDAQSSMPGPMTGPRQGRQLRPEPPDRVDVLGSQVQVPDAHRSSGTCQPLAYDFQFAAARSASSSRTQP